MSAPCPLCQRPDASPWVTSGAFRYAACAGCGHVWLDPLPDEAWLAQYYDEGYFAGGDKGGYRDYMADAALHADNARARLALAARLGATPPGLWLDVGCAAGFTLAVARDAGFTAAGVEHSHWAARIARERFGLPVFHSLEKARAEHAGQASVVSFFQVLEHLRDPLAALRDARACLRPDGLVLIETWDRGSAIARLSGARWQQITPPSVLHLFDRRSLGFALERAGLALGSVRATGKRVSLGWVLGILAEKRPGLFAPLLRALEPYGLLAKSFTYRLGDLVTAAARPEGA